MKRLSLGLLIGCGTLFGQATCRNYRDLLEYQHLDIAVHVDTSNPRVVEAAAKAMDWWSKQIDMSWHFTTSATDCTLELRPHVWVSKQLPGSINVVREIGGAHLPRNRLYDGVIFFLYPAVGYDLVRCFVHEFGHLLGLEHTSDPDSIMFSNPDEALLTLTHRDVRQVQRYHALRKEAM